MMPLGAALHPFHSLFSGCNVPCFAGIIRGETPIDDVASVLKANLSDATIQPSSGGVMEQPKSALAGAK
jgi:hypothetical protein